MKKNLLLIATCCILSSVTFIYAQNPVPNPGFENWTAGNPDSWLTNNITGFAITITQATPPYSGTYAAKGEVITSLAGNLAPILASTDASGNGFPVSQAYGTLSFYYKFNQIGTNTFLNVAAAFYDAGGNGVGAAGLGYGMPASTFTLVNLPIYYSNPNPAECAILITISDSTGAMPAVGNYFVIDDVSLSGTVGIEESQSPLLSIQKVKPNPVNNTAFIYYSLPANSDVLFELIDVTGRKYHEMSVTGEMAGEHKIEFNASVIPGGFYYLTMKTSSGIASIPIMVVH